ncbi:hypothetical protein GCM10023196_036790 [Actinoallomurus vinaceus]|uniref:Uncharacterized protein n=2 Tax=Actinoallomurus vinaceus TaxID=1080074 RepID=A0ABP8UAZ7_9ACTN
MYDAADPPAHPPKWEVVAFYIGGDTPHVWTAEEIAAQPARYRLPIYVRSNPDSHDPHVDAAEAIAQLHAFGAPRGCAVSLDLEMAVNASYVRAFDADIVAAGYVTVEYGSLSAIFRNPRTSGGVWAAHYTGTPHLEPGSVATQWADDQLLGTDYDASLIDDSVPLWDTQHSQEDEMAAISSLGAGDGQAIPASNDASLQWSKVFSDKHKFVSPGKDGKALSVYPDGPYWAVADAIVELHGFKAGDPVDIAWTRMKSDGKGGWVIGDDAWRTTFHANADGVVREQLSAQFGVDKPNPVRVRVYNPNAYPITVQGAMAKLTLLKY